MSTVSYAFVIPVKVPSQNRLLSVGSGGKTPAQRAAVNRKRYELYRDQMHQVFRSEAARLDIPPASGPRRVTWTRILGKRERAYDDANFVGGLKPIVDALVSAGLLVDDNPTLYEGVYRQDSTQRSRGPALVVEIEDMDERRVTA